MAAAAPPCALSLSTSLDIETLSNGLVAVPAEINGHATRLVVDTGSIYSSLADDLTDELGLAREEASRIFMLSGGVPLYQTVEAGRFVLGSMQAERQSFYVVPAENIAPDAQGLLGPDLFTNYDLEFDFAAGKFNLFSQKHCRGQVVYWTQTPYASVPLQLQKTWQLLVSVNVDGHPLRAVIDTGAESSTMSLGTAEKIFGLKDDSAGMKELPPISVNRTARVKSYRYPFQAMTFGGITVKNPDILLLPGDEADRREPDMVLGVSILRQLHLYVAYDEQMLYVTPAEAR